MKLSIAWIFDHIDAAWNAQTVEQLIPLFNQKVAEIEGYYSCRVNNLEDFSIASVKEVHVDKVIVYSTQWQKEMVMPLRKGVLVGQHYMIKKMDRGLLHTI